MTALLREVNARRGVQVLNLPLRDARREFEAHYFSCLLEQCGGNAREAARLAGVSEGAIYRKLRHIGLGPEVRRTPDG